MKQLLEDNEMSKAVKLDHEFDKDRFATLLERACGSRRKKDFADDAGLSRAYLIKHMNKNLASPPTPASLKKIADASQNGVMFADLLDAAGYNPDRFLEKREDQLTSGSDDFLFRARAVILFKIYKRGLVNKGISDSNNYAEDELQFSIDDPKIKYWKFTFLNEDMWCKTENEARLMILSFYEKMLSMPAESKMSFVTDSEEIFEQLMEIKVPAIAIYVSIMLLEKYTMKVLKEEYIESNVDDYDGVPSLL